MRQGVPCTQRDKTLSSHPSVSAEWRWGGALCEHPAMGFLSDQGIYDAYHKDADAPYPRGTGVSRGRRPILFVLVVIFLIVAIGPLIANLLLDWLK
jgi:hypothetical protein